MTSSRPLLLFVQPRFGEVAVPMDIAAIIGNLPRDSFRIRVFDLSTREACDRAELLKTAAESRLVFISTYCVSLFNEERDWPVVMRILREVRQAGAVHVVVGGRYPIAAAKYLGQEDARYIWGDVERMIPFALSESGTGITQIPEVGDLDQLGFPDYSHFDLARYPVSTACDASRSLPVLSSRGCNRDCSYCYVKRGYGRRSAGHVIAEIRDHVERLGVTHFVIEDDLFNHDAEHVRMFCDELIARGPRITWQCLNGLNPGGLPLELLPLMAKAGCRHVALGIESFNVEILKKWHREGDPKRIAALVDRARECGMLVTGYFLMDSLDGLSVGQWLKELHAIRGSRIDFPHFSYSDGGNGFRASLSKKICYLYVYANHRRILTLGRLGVFSSRKIHRLWSKWKRG